MAAPQTQSRLSRFLSKPLHDKLNVLREIKPLLAGKLYYRFVVASFGHRTLLRKPLRITNPRYIFVGSGVDIAVGCRLEAIVTDPECLPKLIVEDGVYIGQNVQIISHCNVTIGKNAGIGPHCFVMDASHPVLDRTDPAPMVHRFSTAESFLEIGEGALIGAGTFIMPNVRIGKRTVIGANSVVRKSIPDDCIAYGNPAVVVLRFDRVEERWIPVPGR
ncbi:MAG: acyltransferase [Acidobacteriota bacterium]|nr:acyltransferase [Acidobacteriota bacterium]